MPWTIDVEERGHIVRVVSDGPMPLVTISQLSAEAIAAAPPGRMRKFLADDRRMLPRLSTTEIFDLPGTLEDLGLRKADRVALVYSTSSAKRSDFEFFETVARNRGFAVQLFTDPEKAREWLNAR
jgi:hypothetical protein